MDEKGTIISFHSSSRIGQIVPAYLAYPDASDEESQRIFESLREEYDYLQAYDSQYQRTRCISYSQEYKQAVKVGEQLKQLNQMVSEGRKFLQGVSQELKRMKEYMRRLRDPSYEGSNYEEEQIDSDRSAIQI